jgi:hypothetical protein
MQIAFYPAYGERAPTARAMLRLLQCVACVVGRLVRLTTRRIKWAVMVGVRPGRGASSSNPAMPKLRKRFRQRDTFFGVIFEITAISLSRRPSAANKTIRSFYDACCKRPTASPLFQVGSLFGTQGNGLGRSASASLLIMRREQINNGCYL